MSPTAEQLAWATAVMDDAMRRCASFVNGKDGAAIGVIASLVVAGHLAIREEAPKVVTENDAASGTEDGRKMREDTKSSSAPQAATVTSPGTHLERARDELAADLCDITGDRLTSNVHFRLVDFMLARESSVERAAFERAATLLESAWGIIANASGGNWDHKDNHPDWKAAAERWRDAYFAEEDRLRAAAGAPEEPK